MPFSRRIQERRQERLAERRQAKLDARLAEEIERQKEEARREEARLEYEAMVAALEAAKARRDELLAKLRAQKLAERKAAERQTARQAGLLEMLRQASALADAIERQKEEQEKARREAALESARKERRKAEPAQQKAPAKERRPSEKAVPPREKAPRALEPAPLPEKSAARQPKQRQAIVDERRSAKRESAQGSALREARLERKKAEEQRAAAQAARLERLKELRPPAAPAEKPQEPSAPKPPSVTELEKAAEKRQAALQARLGELRQAEKERAAANERRLSSLNERLAALRKADENRRKAAERRTAALKARQEEAASAESERRRADEQRKAALQERLANLQAADRPNKLLRQPLPEAPARNPLLDPLAGGVLSGSLPWLRATGNRITTISGDPVLLRGVNLLGMDSAPPDPRRGFAAGAGITPQVIEAALSWGTRVIRLAINRGRVLEGAGGLPASAYLEDLDELIRLAAQGGAYTLLSLRRLDETSAFGSLPAPGGGSMPNRLAPQPGFEHFELWRILAGRYALEPAVLYDLYAAPHPPLPGDESGIESNWDLWTLWVQMSVADIRRVNPGALCFVCGLDWGADLSGFPVLGTAGRPIPNLVYAGRLFPRQPSPWPAMQALGRAHPLFITEWGGQRLDTSWGERTAQLLRAGGIGWAAAHWNAEPSLTRTVRERMYPSTFGALVQRALALEGETLAATLPAEPDTLPTLSVF